MIQNPKGVSIQGKTYTGFYLCFDEDGFYNIRTAYDASPYFIMSVKQFYELIKIGRGEKRTIEEFMEDEFGAIMEKEDDSTK